MSMEDWYELRDLILDATYARKLTASPRLRESHADIVSLVDEFLRTGKGTPMDKATRLVARLCPGISPEVANANPWLLLVKS
jgi:hypothetical protein